MAEEWHTPYEKLSRRTVTFHQAVRSLMEELEATDWYRQRADDCEDPALKEILLHNMREEIEHASMILEWLRRTDADFARQFDTYLYSGSDIAGTEEAADSASPPSASSAPPSFTVGAMKGEGKPWSR